MSKLKDTRISKGLSRQELSDKADVKLTAIRDYEQNHKPINKAQVMTVYKLAKALDVNTEELIELNQD